MSLRGKVAKRWQHLPDSLKEDARILYTLAQYELWRRATDLAANYAAAEVVQLEILFGKTYLQMSRKWMYNVLRQQIHESLLPEIELNRFLDHYDEHNRP